VTDLASSASGVAALAEPVRRDLYLFVVAQDAPVSREQAAEGVGVATHTAKFHLDRLAADGLLDVEYRRLGERRGPGAGRPTKLYRRSAREVSVTLPPRRYDLASTLMARAIESSARQGTPVLGALEQEADRLGRELAAHAAGPGPARRPGGAVVREVLAEHGYEPCERDGAITLTNCPFRALVAEHTELVCGMNLALLSAVTAAADDLAARLDPAPDRCCVVLGPTRPGGDGSGACAPH
jgi:predicted ArsR family transcriptional regulator